MQPLIDELRRRLDDMPEAVAERVMAATSEAEIEKILRDEIVRRVGAVLGISPND